MTEVSLSEVLTLKQDGNLLGALDNCLKFLANNPTHAEARLIYAQILYEYGCQGLSVEQVRSLYERFSEKNSIRQLLEVIDPEFKASTIKDPRTNKVEQGSNQEDNASVIAETDLNLDDLD